MDTDILTSAIVPSGTTAFAEDDFRYVAITPVTLFSGHSYVIGANNPTNNGHNERFALNVGTISFDPSIVFNGERFVQNAGDQSFGDSLSFPENYFIAESFFGPNFQFNQAAAVPEPSSLALFGVGLFFAGVGAAFRGRRKCSALRAVPPCSGL